MTTPAWLARHLVTPCVIYNRVQQGVDEYNNPAYVEEPVQALCYFQPASQEDIQDGRAEVGQYLLHLGADTAGLLDGFARVEVGGQSYEAVAPPAVYPSLIQPDTHHVELTVQRSTA